MTRQFFRLSSNVDGVVPLYSLIHTHNLAELLPELDQTLTLQFDRSCDDTFQVELCRIIRTDSYNEPFTELDEKLGGNKVRQNKSPTIELSLRVDKTTVFSTRCFW